MCGGTLVSPRHVISALHCFNKKNIEFKIGVGKHRRNGWDEGTEEAVSWLVTLSLYIAITP